MVTFGDVLHVDFCFDCFECSRCPPGTSKYLAAEAIKYIRYRNGRSTRTGAAAQCVCEKVLTDKCGLPPDASCIDVVFVTDGRSNAGPTVCETVQCIHNYVNSDGSKSIVTHAIGIDNFRETELNCIAGYGNNGLTHVHPYLKEKYVDFDQFEHGIKNVTNRIRDELLNGTSTCV